MTTLTIPAPKIEIGDRIDGRTVRAVTGRSRRSASNSACPHRGRSISVSGHVVCVGFDDDGPWKYIFGSQTVDVERGAALPEAA